MSTPNTGKAVRNSSGAAHTGNLPLPVTFFIHPKHPIDGVSVAFPASDLLRGSEPKLLSTSAAIRTSPIMLSRVVPLVSRGRGVPRLLNRKALLGAFKKERGSIWCAVNESQLITTVEISGDLDPVYLDALEFSLEAQVTQQAAEQILMLVRLAGSDRLLSAVRDILDLEQGEKLVRTKDIQRIFSLERHTALNRRRKLYNEWNIDLAECPHPTATQYEVGENMQGSQGLCDTDSQEKSSASEGSSGGRDTLGANDFEALQELRDLPVSSDWGGWGSESVPNTHACAGRADRHFSGGKEAPDNLKESTKNENAGLHGMASDFSSSEESDAAELEAWDNDRLKDDNGH